MMTRETKIGLLVGLAFVIVVGILLSDHLSAATEPAAAPLRLAGDSVRTSLGETTVTDLGGTVRIPAGVAPPLPLPTARELVARANVPHSGGIGLPALAQGDAATDGVPRVLRDLARRGGEDVVPADDRPANHTAVGPDDARPVPPARKAETYKAEAGDNLGAMAGKMLGANNKANRDLIVAANPTLQSNPNMIIAGHTYNVPTATPAGRAAVVPVVNRVPAPATPPVPSGHYRHGRRPAAE